MKITRRIDRLVDGVLDATTLEVSIFLNYETAIITVWKIHIGSGRGKWHSKVKLHQTGFLYHSQLPLSYTDSMKLAKQLIQKKTKEVTFRLVQETAKKINTAFIFDPWEHIPNPQKPIEIIYEDG